MKRGGGREKVVGKEKEEKKKLKGKIRIKYCKSVQKWQKKEKRGHKVYNFVVLQEGGKILFLWEGTNKVLEPLL